MGVDAGDRLCGRDSLPSGRRVIGQQPANVTPVVRGIGKVKALLIGDPSDNLSDARDEVQWLADRLQADGRFEEPDILLGAANCQPGPILSALGSKKYGLLHYSGDTKFDGYRSAWQLADGKMITTDRLTSALQMGPPRLSSALLRERDWRASGGGAVREPDLRFAQRLFAGGGGGVCGNAVGSGSRGCVAVRRGFLRGIPERRMEPGRVPAPCQVGAEAG